MFLRILPVILFGSILSVPVKKPMLLFITLIQAASRKFFFKLAQNLPQRREDTK
jgi:hypothetical protein